MRIYPGRIMNNFIEQNKRQYAIPVYQRNYEWSADQCEKLFQDIVVASQRGKEHFCGSVVYSLVRYENNINHYIVIDGQQRMTTVYLLLKALMDMANDEGEKQTIYKVLINQDAFQSYSVDAASKLKLKPIKSDNNQLMLLMDGKVDQVDKSSGIWRNYDLFCRLIKEQQEKGIGVTQIYYGLQQLTCVDISLDQEDNAQKIFERINSTGVPLSLSDKIRNFVLMVDAEQDELYENYWLKTENLLKNSSMESFFVDYLNMKVDGFTKYEDAYDDFKNFYRDNEYTNKSVLQEILHYAQLYHAFVNADDSQYCTRINHALAGLQKLKQTTSFLFLFRVFDDLQAGVVSQEEVADVLEFLLNYSIRRLVCEIGSNSLRGLYKTLYTRVFIRPENKKHYYDSVVSFFKQLTTKDAFPTDSDFVNALKFNNLYRKNSLCKYLLVKIENQGKEQLITDNLTIEHIMPQNKNLSSSWQKMLGDNWYLDKDKYLHTLGNLTLTAYNSELGDKPFAEKKKKLNAVTKVVTLYADVRNCEVWNSSTIETRAENLSKVVLNLYPTIDPKEQISFSDPRYQEYTCEDPNNATFKVPQYFVLQGERITVSTFADMLRLLVKRLYTIDKSIIESLARNNEKVLSWSQSVLFSYDKDVVNTDEKIPNTEIYLGLGYSASHIMYIIQALLDLYDIDRSDFVYSARKSIAKKVS